MKKKARVENVKNDYKQQCKKKNLKHKNLVTGNIVKEEKILNNEPNFLKRDNTYTNLKKPCEIMTDHKKNLKYVLDFIEMAFNFSNLYSKLVDEEHRNLLGMCVRGQEVDMSHILHLLFYCLKVAKDVKGSSKIKCNFCAVSGKHKQLVALEEKFLAYVSSFKQELSVLLNAFYEIPLPVIYDFFKCWKVSTNTKSGMYPFDVCQVIFNEKKIYDSSFNTPNRFYGILYKHNEQSDCVYKLYADLILNDAYEKGSTCSLLLYATGTIVEPQHFCAFFVDHVTRTVFFYNSLGEKDQVVEEALINKINHINYEKQLPEYKFVFNKGKQQKNNKLCGIYATRFLVRMYNCESKDRLEFFHDIFDVDDDLDTEMCKMQVEFVHVNNTNTYLLPNTAMFNIFDDIFS